MTAPFDGVVTARQVSIGQLVGANSPTDARDHRAARSDLGEFHRQRARRAAGARRSRASRGETTAALIGLPVEVGLQNESGYPHHGKLDYVAPNVDPSTGTLAARASWRTAIARCCPAISCACAFPSKPQPALLVPDVALGSDQGGRYVLVVNKDNVVEQRKVEPGQLVGDLRVIEKGLTKDDRVVVGGIMRAIPGEKVDAEQLRRRRKLARDDPAMISKFFIERPVLANVLAILMILIGAVALYALPVAQYPDVVPPTVQVTTRYPGASARTVMDTVALPIEQQVNGVENMIYMQSTSASDGSLYAHGDLQDRHRSRCGANPGAEPGGERAVAVAAGGAGAGRHGAEAFDRDPAVRHFDVAGRPLRQPLSRQLRHHQSSGRAVATARRRQRQRVRRRPIFDAHLARSGKAQGAQPQRPGRRRGAATAEPGSDRRPDRHAADAARRQLPIHHRAARPAHRRRSIRERHRQDRQQRRGHARARRRPRRARRADLQPVFHARRQAGGRHRHLSIARRQRARRRA